LKIYFLNKNIHRHAQSEHKTNNIINQTKQEVIIFSIR